MHTILFPTVSMTTGGAEQQLLELVRGLDKRTFRPIVALLQRGGTREAELLAIPDVEVVYLDRRHKLDFSPVWKLARLIRQRKVAVVQPFVSPALCFGLLAGLLARATSKGGLPALIGTERGGARRAPGLGGRFYLTASDQLLRFTDAVVANSEAGRMMVRRHGVSLARTLVIANGLNPARLQPSWEQVSAHRRRLGAADGGPIVGMLATLKPAKGQDVFLQAAAEVARVRPDVRFAIVGNGPWRTELEALAAQLGLADRVVFFGFQSRVADFLALFNLLVSASRDNEGHSNSILEAMALGTPVIATDIGGSRELVDPGRTGLLIPTDDPSALASAMLSVLEDAAGTHAMIAQARALVNERFTLERMVTSYERLYTACLNRAQGVRPFTPPTSAQPRPATARSAPAAPAAPAVPVPLASEHALAGGHSRHVGVGSA